MKTLVDIIQILRNKKSDLIKRYPISSIGVFGSYARNEQSDYSDVDLLVEIDGRIGSRFIDLAEEFEKLLGLKVDLVSKKGLKEKYFKAIEKDIKYV
ncbi:nucleotidyltransferase family protein [Echinicola marina]|uniref:nucleotidyltransferase family protein n=1 Tax=Echinicola marina TaxID=2859768 RepID=UPI001CF67F0F|nr:nucleotidyltransferase family protein [Echinicola marina]UCS91973.1 nucleotidyltransferase family protein [Echinicola marina]